MTDDSDGAGTVLRSIYPSPPTDLGAAFKAHVASTGQPETFPNISTTKPPKTGAVQVLAMGVSVDRKKRPGQSKAPCPICSRQSGKWLENGSLIWCEETQAIYAIGPQCYQTLWTDGRMDVAMNVFLQEQRERDNKERLVAAAKAAVSVRTWIAAERPTAEHLAQLQAEFAKAAPRLRNALSRALKGHIGAVKGRGFLRGAAQPGKRLDEADTVFVALQKRAGADPAAWVEDLSPRVVAERLAEIDRAREALEIVVRVCDEAAAFLQPSSVQALAQLSRTPDFAVQFRAPSTATRATFETDRERWQAPLGVKSCKPLPAF